MAHDRVISVVSLLMVLCALTGCQTVGRQGMTTMAEFVVEVDANGHYGLAFPVHNSTSQVLQLPVWHVSGLVIVSLQADGREVPPHPGGVSVGEEDPRMRSVDPGEQYGYVLSVHTGRVVASRPRAEDEAKLGFVSYSIPPNWQTLQFGYAVLDRSNGALFCRNTVRFHRYK